VLARIQQLEILGAGQRPSGEPSAFVEGLGEVFVTLRGVIDPTEVRKRLERDVAKIDKELAGVDAKLGRPDFVDKAPAEIVEKERQRATTLRERHGTLQRHLAALREG
jgi:valyl-tRNA synthetase